MRHSPSLYSPTLTPLNEPADSEYSPRNYHYLFKLAPISQALTLSKPSLSKHQIHRRRDTSIPIARLMMTMMHR